MVCTITHKDMAIMMLFGFFFNWLFLFTVVFGIRKLNNIIFVIYEELSEILGLRQVGDHSMRVPYLLQDLVDVELASKLFLTLFKGPLPKHERTFPKTTAVSAATQDRCHEGVVKQLHHRYVNCDKLVRNIRFHERFSTLVLRLLGFLIRVLLMFIFLSNE